MRPALALALALTLAALPARAETALAAVAANFASLAEALAAEFNAATGHQVSMTTGSTGKLYAQITQGAPFDLMLSADSEIPARLAAQGHGTPFAYALGLVVLWVPGAAPGSDPATVLQAPDLRHLAIANPDLAPYGKASLAVLDALGLHEALEGRIVLGQNIGQTFALVESGAADGGFVALSALPADAPGLVWQPGPDLVPPIRQDAILLKHGAGNAAAQAFLDHLRSAPARARIAAAGYGLPE